VKFTLFHPTISDPTIFFATNREVKGVTKTAEAGESPQTFYIFYMMPLTQISVSGSNMDANYTLLMSIDKTESNAR